MRTVTSLFLVALLVASAVADCVTRGPVDNFVGDHSALDSVVSCSGNLQSLVLPATALGGHDAVTFEVEVYPRAFTGCIFSYGAGADYIGLRFAVDSTNQLGQVHFTVGSQTVSTQGVVTPNTWHTIAVVVRNNADLASATATLYIDGIAYPAGSVGTLGGSSRSGSLGYCGKEHTFFNGAIDNLIITAKAKSLQDLKDTQSLIYPFVLENDLVQMWTYNDDGTTTSAFTGMAADAVATSNMVPTPIVAGQTAAAVCTREVKNKYPGARIVDKFCRQQGSVRVTPGSTDVATMTNDSPFNSLDGGLSQTFACDGGAAFTFNQKWQSGGVIEVTIKTSLNHRFRVAANPGAPLAVDHQSWGGWTRLSTGSGIVAEDRSAFSIGDTEFVIQAAGIGWISVTQAGGFLNFQYALSSAACPAATCDYIVAEEYQYNFQNPPLPEPMGNQQTTSGIQNLPPVLACPDPRLNGYNPFMYCWGWWVGPQVGYVRDWNGNVWQTSDPGCCHNPAVTSGGQWSLNAWGYLTAGKTLPWCEDFSFPPLTPPKGTTGVPTYPTDPCDGIDPADLTTFKGICSGLWGSDQTDGRYLGCVAQLCITKDPDTVPPPDCRTEKLLNQLDANHAVPAKCNVCPGSCNFRGTCNTNTLKCTCDANWAGPDCGQPTAFPCWSTGVAPDDIKLLPFQLRTLDPSAPTAPVLTQTMSDPLYTQFAWPGQYKIADTLFIYVAQSVADFNSPVAKFHLWIVSNNGAGYNNVDYTLTFAANTLSGAELDIFGVASPVSGSNQNGAFYPQLNRVFTGTSFSVRFNHAASQMSGAVIRNIPDGFTATISIAANGGANVISQVLVGGSSSSAKAKFDVVKISNAAAIAGFTLGGTTCSNPAAGCPSLDCGACTANANCGWCVETGQCMLGSVTGPAFGECSNWRKTFNPTVSRRVTQIPAYPVNPGLTEVYLSPATDLGVEIGITPYPFKQSEWDSVVMTDFGSLPKEAMKAQMQDILATASSFPNAGISFTSIINGYRLVEPITNPRATVGLPESIAMLSTAFIPVSTGAADVDKAVAALATKDDLRFRRGTRKMALFLVNRDHDGTSEITGAIADALLVKNIVPVFAVPAAYIGSYRAIVAAIGFGHVILLSPRSTADNFNYALSIAGSSIAVTVPTGERTTTHIDWTQFSTNIDRFAVANLPSNFRAKFSVPLTKNTVGPLDVRTTNLVFPGYGNAVVENIPSGQYEKPWTTAGGKVSMLADQTPYLIELTGHSFRGLMAVTPTLTGIPDVAYGNLYYAVRITTAGEAKWVQGDLITAAMLPKVIGDARVVFVPVNPTPAGTPTTLTYKVQDRCIASDDGTINIEVTPTNKAPFADMPNLVTRQYTALEFVLGFGDDKKATAGPNAYIFNIVSTIADRDGALYKWSATFDITNPPPADKILDGAQLTDPRVIYAPTRFKYSDAVRADLLILPCLIYNVEEAAGTETPTLKSNDKQVIITVTHVNVSPFVWDEAGWLLTPSGAGTATWPVVDPAFCKDTCSFQEDFGEQFWWNTGFEYIYLGGEDLEGDDLTYEITMVDCFPGADVKLPLSDIDNAKPGDQIATKFHSGQLNPTIRFRPARETSDSNRFDLDGKSYYCKIGYRVIDSEDAVSNDKVITINVSNLNKQPRLEEEVTRIVALEEQRHGFFLSAIDPEDDAFTLSFAGCVKNIGKIELCTNSLCEATVTLDCSVVYNAANPTVTALSGVAVGEKINGQTAPIQGFFTSGPVGTFSEGEEYNTVHFVLSDSVSTFAPTKATVIFDVKILNVAPKLFIQQEDRDEYTIAPAVGSDFLVDVTVTDDDFADSDFYVMTVRGSMDNTKTTSSRFAVAEMIAAVPDCTADAIVTDTTFEYTCTLPSVQAFLRSVKVIAPLVLGAGEGFVGVKITANDNGFVGQCDVPYVTNAPCPLEDSVSISITYTPASDNSVVTVASSAAAAGVAGAAAIAAVALFRRLNKKAEESYQPWDSNEDDDATAVNPLYQESGSKGQNALYEAKSDL